MAGVWKTAGKGLVGTDYARKERKREVQYKERECVEEMSMERKILGSGKGVVER